MTASIETVDPDDDNQSIDALVRAFFSAFTNVGPAPPNVRVLRDLFIPEGVIVKCSGAAPEVFDLPSFIAPREALLTDGTLVDFEEREIWSRTDVFGNVAQRVCAYSKSGVLSGCRFSTSGVKVMQMIRTPAGWKLSSVAWDDERDGFVVPLHPGAGDRAG